MASGARGGGAQHLLGLLPLLQDRGLAVSALVGDDGPLAEQLRMRHVPVTSMPLFGKRGDHRWLGRLEAVLDREQPDVVHYHGTRAGFWGGCLRWVRSVQRSVYTAHGLASRVTRPFGLRRLFGLAETVACRADAVISVSRADLDTLQAHHGLATRRAHHIGNAVDLGPRLAKDKGAARCHLGLPTRGLWVGCVARLAPQKAVGDLLDAMQQVPHAQVAVIGDGPLATPLSRHPLAREGRVRFLGARDDVPRCLAAFDVFALSSHWEGEPIALLEAMATGLPCVATRTSGAAELLRHGDTGWLVEIGDTVGLGLAIAKLLDDAPGRRRLGARARAFANERSYTRVSARTMMVYARVLGDLDLRRTAEMLLQPLAAASRAGAG